MGTMNRSLPLLLVVGAAAGAIWFAFAPKRDPAALEKTLPAYVFGNTLPRVHPPESALQKDVLSDPVRRALSRIEWGPPDIVYFTQRHFPTDPKLRAALARGLVLRFEETARGAPLLGVRFLQALGLLGDPAGLDAVVRAAEGGPMFLREAAIRALAGFPLTDALRDVYVQLSSDPDQEVVRIALNEFIKRENLGDAATIEGFLQSSSGANAVPWLQQVATRKLPGLADACARHLDSASPRARANAILALLVERDPRGVAAATQQLGAKDAGKVVEALSIFRDAALEPPLDRVRTLSEDASGEVRRYVAQALGPWTAAADEEAVVAILRRLAADSDAIVQKTAVEQLWHHGRREGLEEWSERLQRGHGNELREAVQLLCEALKDQASFQVARTRLAQERLDGNDQSNLLYGLRFAADAKDLDLFVNRVAQADSPADLRVGDRGWLSEYAGVYVQSYAAAGIAPLVALLKAADRDRPRWIALDALRGVLKSAAGADAKAAVDAVLALAEDPRAAVGLRGAALDTLPFFDDLSLGPRLFDLRDRLGDPTLAARATTLFSSYF
jgi:hypothetical protein